MRLGTTELLIIMGIAILIFGPKKLPQLGKAMGQTIGNFKRSSKRAEDEAFPAAAEQAEAGQNQEDSRRYRVPGLCGGLPGSEVR